MFKEEGYAPFLLEMRRAIDGYGTLADDQRF